MKFTVVWKPSAKRDLATLWEAAEDWQAIAAAANGVQSQLTRAADRAGESREGDDRIIFKGPLAVTYRVSTTDRTAVVLQVRHIG